MFVEQKITHILYGKSISQKQLAHIIHLDCVLNRLLSWNTFKMYSNTCEICSIEIYP